MNVMGPTTKATNLGRRAVANFLKSKNILQGFLGGHYMPTQCAR